MSRLELLRHLEMFENPNFGRSGVADKLRANHPPPEEGRSSSSRLRKQPHQAEEAEEAEEEEERRVRPASERRGQLRRPRGESAGHKKPNGGHYSPREEMEAHGRSRRETGGHESAKEIVSRPGKTGGGEPEAPKRTRGGSGGGGGRVKRVHDSWSSRASSILAVVAEAEVSNRKNL